MAKPSASLTSSLVFKLAAGVLLLMGVVAFFSRDLDDVWFFQFGQGRNSPYKELANTPPTHLSADAWRYSRLEFGEAAHFECIRETLTFDTSVREAQVFCECYVGQLKKKFGTDLIDNQQLRELPHKARHTADAARAERRYCVRRIAEILGAR